VEFEFRVQLFVGELFASVLELRQSSDIAKSMLAGSISMNASIAPSSRWMAPAPGHAR